MVWNTDRYISVIPEYFVLSRASIKEKSGLAMQDYMDQVLRITL